MVKKAKVNLQIYEIKERGSFPALPFFWRYHPDLNRGISVLQTDALPLGYGTVLYCKKMERMTRLELATSTLARWRSTR